MLDLVPIGADFAYCGKTLSERVTGRFYTPDVLASELAQQMLEAFTDKGSDVPLRVIDPFSGDGQLVSALVIEASKYPSLRRRTWRISIWDRDQSALARAVARIERLASMLEITMTLESRVVDSFATELTSAYDLVITNPPWEHLKPDSREMARMSSNDAADYRQRLRAVSNALDDRFPNSKASGAWGGWATNLARCGWDLSMQLLGKHGILGIVLPSTLLGDQSSEQIRRLTFCRHHVLDVAAYPSEARLFERVDQPVVAMTIGATTTERSAPGRVRIFDADRRVRHVVPIASPSDLASNGYAISVGFGAGASGALDCVQRLPRLSEFEGTGPRDLWMGRELDETRIFEKTVTGPHHPFVKGRMIARHTIAEHPVRSVRADLASKFQSAAFHRAVWRDVSRPSQKRRMIGSVIPPGWITGNSLHVAHFRDGDLKRTLALHGLLSSLVLEFQVRSRLATGHMSLGAVRQSRVPELTRSVVATLARGVTAVQEGRSGAAVHLEVMVAKAYGLNRNTMEAIVGSFDKIEDEERGQLLDSALWSGGGAS